MDDAGDFTVTWESNQNGNYDVYARRYARTSLVQYVQNYGQRQLERAALVERHEFAVRLRSADRRRGRRDRHRRGCSIRRRWAI